MHGCLWTLQDYGKLFAHFGCDFQVGQGWISELTVKKLVKKTLLMNLKKLSDIYLRLAVGDWCDFAVPTASEVCYFAPRDI